VLLFAVLKDVVGPGIRAQHGHRSEDIGHIDEEVLEHEDVQPEISKISQQ